MFGFFSEVNFECFNFLCSICYGLCCFWWLGVFLVDWYEDIGVGVFVVVNCVVVIGVCVVFVDFDFDVFVDVVEVVVIFVLEDK